MNDEKKIKIIKIFGIISFILLFFLFFTFIISQKEKITNKPTCKEIREGIILNIGVGEITYYNNLLLLFKYEEKDKIYGYRLKRLYTEECLK